MSPWWALLLLSLSGSMHCAGMCGPIYPSLTPTIKKPSQAGFLYFHIGRLVSYITAAILFSVTIQTLNAFLGFWFQLTIFSIGALVMLGAAIRILNWPIWNPWNLFERWGSHALWKYLSPKIKTTVSTKKLSPKRLLIMGWLWGWIPCGLVYSALPIATIYSSWWTSAAMMSVFWLGTLPSLWLVQRAFQPNRPYRKVWQRLCGYALLLLALYHVGLMAIYWVKAFDPNQRASIEQTICHGRD